MQPEKPDPPSKPPPALEYDRNGFRVSRRQWRTLILLTLLNTVLLGWFVIGPQSTQFIQTQWKQWQSRRAHQADLRELLAHQQLCLNYAMPEGQVIYEEEPISAQHLIADQASYIPRDTRTGPRYPAWPAAAILKSQPAPWAAFLSDVYNLQSSRALPMLYLCERTSPGGAHRIVVVQWSADQDFVGVDQWANPDRPRDRYADLNVAKFRISRSLLATAIVPATRQHGPSSGELAVFQLHFPDPFAVLIKDDNTRTGHWDMRKPVWVTMLAGQSDPKDASHFVLPYRLNGKEDAIDGWLTDQGLLFKGRTGSPVTEDGKKGWRIPVSNAAPTTAPDRQQTPRLHGLPTDR